MSPSEAQYVDSLVSTIVTSKDLIVELRQKLHDTERALGEAHRTLGVAAYGAFTIGQGGQGGRGGKGGEGGQDGGPGGPGGAGGRGDGRAIQGFGPGSPDDYPDLTMGDGGRGPDLSEGNGGKESSVELLEASEPSPYDTSIRDTPDGQLFARLLGELSQLSRVFEQTTAEDEEGAAQKRRMLKHFRDLRHLAGLAEAKQRGLEHSLEHEKRLRAQFEEGYIDLRGKVRDLNDALITFEGDQPNAKITTVREMDEYKALEFAAQDIDT